jgi:hypothetical protein
MPVFTVHAPVAAAANRNGADQVVFVRDGFHFWAFLFGPLWFAWHRLWLVLLVDVLIIAGLAFLLTSLRAAGDIRFVAMLLLALLTGYEAASAWRWSLSRGRWRERGIVVADDAEAAERRFFAQWGEDAKPGPTASGRLPPRDPSGPSTEVIGLFPQPGRAP